MSIYTNNIQTTPVPTHSENKAKFTPYWVLHRKLPWSFSHIIDVTGSVLWVMSYKSSVGTVHSIKSKQREWKQQKHGDVTQRMKTVSSCVRSVIRTWQRVHGCFLMYLSTSFTQYPTQAQKILLSTCTLQKHASASQCADLKGVSLCVTRSPGPGGALPGEWQRGACGLVAPAVRQRWGGGAREGGGPGVRSQSAPTLPAGAPRASYPDRDTETHTAATPRCVTASAPPLQPAFLLHICPFVFVCLFVFSSSLWILYYKT